MHFLCKRLLFNLLEIQKTTNRSPDVAKGVKIPASYRKLSVYLWQRLQSLRYFMLNLNGEGNTLNTTMNADEIQYQHYPKGLQQEAK